jgi:hypothetical protein
VNRAALVEINGCLIVDRLPVALETAARKSTNDADEPLEHPNAIWYYESPRLHTHPFARGRFRR